MDDVVDIEDWLINLLNDIHEAASKGENFDLHIEAPYAKAIDEAYDQVRWIEIY